MRLSIAIKEEIRRDTIADAFNKKIDALKNRKQKVAAMLYNFAYTKKERDFMESAPDPDMFGTSTYFKISIGGDVVEFQLSDKKRFPYKKMSHSYVPIVVITPEQNLYKKVEKVLKDERELKEARKAFINKLYQLLLGFNTDKQLLEAWPEGRKYLSKHVKKGGGALVPDSLIHDINEVIKGN